MFIAISNFPMGKAIMDYLDATGIELGEETIFHLDGILLEGELKNKIIEINALDKEGIKNLNYYSSAILSDDLEKIRHWDVVSVDLSVHGVLEMTEEEWRGVAAGEARFETVMKAAIADMAKL